jgi:hypothetical protein
MACVHGELPPRRYDGDAKDVGPQYVRGITPGNGNPPGSCLWLTYSMNKEDIWISRVPVPIRHKVDKWVSDNFDRMKPGGIVTDWNIYSLKWAPVEVAEFPSATDKSLKLGDTDPYDYARAVRVFPNSKKAVIKFDMLAKQSKNGRMEVDILSRAGARPVRIVLGEAGKIEVIDGSKVVKVGSYQADKWLSFAIAVDAGAGMFSMNISDDFGGHIVTDLAFAENAQSVERVSFRTGKYRKLGIGQRENEDDLPNAGDPVKAAVFYINNVSIVP